MTNNYAHFNTIGNVPQIGGFTTHTDKFYKEVYYELGVKIDECETEIPAFEAISTRYSAKSRLAGIQAYKDYLNTIMPKEENNAKHAMLHNMAYISIQGSFMHFALSDDETSDVMQEYLINLFKAMSTPEYIEYSMSLSQQLDARTTIVSSIKNHITQCAHKNFMPDSVFKRIINMRDQIIKIDPEFGIINEEPGEYCDENMMELLYIDGSLPEEFIPYCLQINPKMVGPQQE